MTLLRVSERHGVETCVGRMSLRSGNLGVDAIEEVSVS
jgi:hypothetical protein